MKSKASLVVKQIISALSSIAREKLLGFRSKAAALRARLALFSLLKSSRRLSLGAVTQKIHALVDKMGIKNEDLLEGVEGEHSEGAIVLYNACADDYTDDDDDDKYPDLTHSLFDEEDDEDQLGDGQGSVIDMVKNSKESEGGDFILEDEIDHVADLFIRRFRKQIRLQKLESFKRYQEMLERSV